MIGTRDVRKKSPRGIYVVIPSFRTKSKIIDVIKGIGPEVAGIIVVDDKCPENSGEYVLRNIKDKRVTVVFNEKNMGVGATTIRGYREALKAGAEVVVKLDGDGQMDPKYIGQVTEPILKGRSDYVKGNRFWNIAHVKTMPKVRLLGNLA